MGEKNKGMTFLTIFWLYLMIYFYLGVLLVNVDDFIENLSVRF